MTLRKQFDIKDSENVEDMMLLTPKMLLLFAIFVEFCDANDLPVVVTSLVGNPVTRTSSTHKEGRALDISVKGWTEDQILDLVELFNEDIDIRKMAARSASDGVPRAVVYHDSGYGRHIHLQVRR